MKVDYNLKLLNRLFLVIGPPPGRMLEMGVEETEGNRFGNFRSYPRSEILEMTI
jgi:hypothetical protein